MYKKLTTFIRELYAGQDVIPLHAPYFDQREKDYVVDTIESTFVSSVGQYVDSFENKVANYTGSCGAVATVNGTAALHTALYMAGVEADDLVITQALTFVATCNVLHFMKADPVFVDVNPISLSLCPIALEDYLSSRCHLNNDNHVIDNKNKRRVKAVLPMHTFGHPALLDELKSICDKWQLVLVEDAAESLGSLYKSRHTGTIGDFAALSFNGNKIITTGGGGMVLCNSEKDKQTLKHITTTAKIAHKYEFFHDQAAFNYRMPNLNAALGCAQMDKLELFVSKKRALAEQYKVFFNGSDFDFFVEPDYAKSNYWLNAVLCPDQTSRNKLLDTTNQHNVMTRPVWQLMHTLPMFDNCQRDDLIVSKMLADRLVNLPSSPILEL